MTEIEKALEDFAFYTGAERDRALERVYAAITRREAAVGAEALEEAATVVERWLSGKPPARAYQVPGLIRALITKGTT